MVEMSFSRGVFGAAGATIGCIGGMNSRLVTATSRRDDTRQTVPETPRPNVRVAGSVLDSQLLRPGVPGIVEMNST